MDLGPVETSSRWRPRRRGNESRRVEPVIRRVVRRCRHRSSHPARGAGEGCVVDAQQFDVVVGSCVGAHGAWRGASHCSAGRPAAAASAAVRGPICRPNFQASAAGATPGRRAPRSGCRAAGGQPGADQFGTEAAASGRPDARLPSAVPRRTWFRVADDLVAVERPAGDGCRRGPVRAAPDRRPGRPPSTRGGRGDQLGDPGSIRVRTGRCATRHWRCRGAERPAAGPNPESSRVSVQLTESKRGRPSSGSSAAGAGGAAAGRPHRFVPDVAHGADQRLVLRSELGAQPPDVHVDRAGAAEKSYPQTSCSSWARVNTRPAC